VGQAAWGVEGGELKFSYDDEDHGFHALGIGHIRAPFVWRAWNSPLMASMKAS
jgi:hypothetical protein